MVSLPGDNDHKIDYVEKNGQRYRVGASHQCSTISDELVNLVHAHHTKGLGRRRIWILLKYLGHDISLSSVRRIISGEVRGQLPQKSVSIYD
jgi:hypothetical protein